MNMSFESVELDAVYLNATVTPRLDFSDKLSKESLIFQLTGYLWMIS
ncbi:MAG: hypothetical protein CM1200mP38_2310 [Dehalococcoidia bacterium]|nr:MAG: hypothetical protein CM1200mP38_2310 [Dehalococcoidia bacterium]